MEKHYIIVVFAFLLLASSTFAYDFSITTNKYVFSINESIYASGNVKQNSTAVSNVSFAFSVLDASGSTSNSATLTSNATGQFNYTFSLSATGNYTLLANSSGQYVQHVIKVKSYSTILSSTDKPTYSASAGGVLSVKAIDSTGNGVASQVVSNNLRYYGNNSLVSALDSCTTNTLGECSINFTAPSADGQYMIESSNFEHIVTFVVGGFDATMKVTPGVLGLNGEVTMKVTVKNSNGNGVAASTRQLLITFPNGTEYTVTSMTQAVDSSGSAVTGSYEDKYNATGEGTYKVKATVTAEGSNVTRELVGSFDVRGYVMDIVPWSGQSVFYPSSSVSLGVKLRNASSNDFISGKTSAILSGATVLDSSDQPLVVNVSVSEFASLGSYRVDFVLPSSAQAGTYKLNVIINDSVGTGSGVGYFTVQNVKATAVMLDKFNGSSKTTFLAAKQIVVKLTARNASGTVSISSVTTYTIKDKNGNDVTSLFGTGVSYVSGGTGYVNITAPKNGGNYRIRVKLVTATGSADAEGSIFVSVLGISAKPVSIGGGAGPGGPMPFGGPGFMFAFRPNDTIQLNVTVTSASEKQEGSEFMGFGGGGTEAMGGGGLAVSGGLFGIGGGTAVQGAQVKISKIINTNTDEDLTNSVSGTLTCTTDSSGVCVVSVQPTTNGNNWTGGFYSVLMNASTSDNQTDDGKGFFEVRRYFVDVQIKTAIQDNASSLGFQNFNSWNIGPNDGVVVNVSIREPGTWNTISNTFNVSILGFYYGGTIGNFIFPPKLIDGTTKAYITSSANGTVISAPSGGWKSGFYQIKISVNTTGQIDTGQGFMFSKTYDGFGFPVNPTTLQQDFTARSTENITIKVSVYDVVRHAAAANLTVTKNKIMSFSSFPPSELSYTQNVTQGTTDATGIVLMTLPAPAEGWPKGSYLAVFDVTNGSVSDSVQGFFQIRNFFAEVTSGKWQFGTNESVVYNVTIVSDPSWMRSRFGGCPAGDPGCGSGPPGGGGGGGGGPPSGGGGGNFAEPTSVVAANATGIDIDGDNVKDINITFTRGESNILLVGDLTLNNNKTQNLSISQTVWCGGSGCVTGATSAPNWFESVSCPGQINMTDFNYKNITRNFTGPAVVCMRTSRNLTYKVGAGPPGFFNGSISNLTIQYILEVTGSVGGSAPLNVSSSSGISYFNATLKSMRVSRFDFATGETLLTEGTNYNVTSANGVIVGSGNINIPGIGGIKLKPIGTWSSGFYHVIADFNTSDGTETAESGFQIDTYSINCYRSNWGALQSNQQLTMNCNVPNPAGGNYTNRVDITVERIKKSPVRADVATGWNTTTYFTNSTVGGVAIVVDQSLSTGQYEAVVKFNDSSDVKRTSVWFEVRDFDAQFYSDKWSYSSSDNITFIAKGSSGPAMFRMNISGSPTVYKYDKATWAKSTVSGVTTRAYIDSNLSWNVNVTVINLSKSGGWDEGQYQVVLNLTKVNATNAAQGNPVEVSSWFDVRLFNVYGYASQWSNHPKANITMSIFVGSPTSSLRYSSPVDVNITGVTNTATGAVLVKGTDYNVVDNTTTPFVTGDALIKIVPVSSLPVGSYKAKITVKDSVSGNKVTTDIYFNVVAFYLSVYTEQYEVSTGDNVSVVLYTSSPTGNGSITVSNAAITSLQFCNLNYICSAVSSFNYSFNPSMSKIFINTSGMSQGWYSLNVIVNDTQNANATGYAGFRIKSFALNGFIPYPSGARSGSGYQINETMLLNVTGVPGVNVTNATFSYNDCSSNGCTYKSFLVQIGYNMTAKNALLQLMPANITPAVSNNSWPVNEYAFYSIEVRGVKDGVPTSFFTSASTYFPRASVSGPGSVSTSGSISANVTAFVEPLTGQRLAGANITVTGVLQDTGSALTPISSGKWNVSSKIANSTGTAEMIVLLNGATWPSGNLRVRYSVVLGNASTKAEFTTATSSPSLGVNKALMSRNGSFIFNASLNREFNVTITLQNTASVDANGTLVTLTLPVHATNTSAVIANLTLLSFFPVNITSGSTVSVSPQFNVTAATGNYTTQISVSPPSPFPVISTSYTFEIK